MLPNQLHVFLVPHRSLKEKQTKQNNKMQDCKDDWKDIFGIQHGCYEHRFWVRDKRVASQFIFTWAKESVENPLLVWIADDFFLNF